MAFGRCVTAAVHYYFVNTGSPGETTWLYEALFESWADLLSNSHLF